MSRPEITVVCEDKQQATFVRRFFKKRKIQTYTVTNTSGGAGDQFVLETFPIQLHASRKKGGTLVAMIDGDQYTVEQRKGQMDEACRARGIEPRTPSDKVAVLVPRRNIETWFAYLDGKEIDEATKYPKLRTPNDCARHVDELWKMCSRDQKLRIPSPPSLKVACSEYQTMTW